MKISMFVGVTMATTEKSKLEEFDHRSVQYQNIAKDNLPSLLESVRGQGLCISLLLNSECLLVLNFANVAAYHIVYVVA